MQKSRDQLSCPVPAVKMPNPIKKNKSGMLSRDHSLSVEWSDEDRAYVGYCRELFPYGGVCHDENRIAAYAKLVELVEWHLEAEAAAVSAANAVLHTKNNKNRSKINPRLSHRIDGQEILRPQELAGKFFFSL
jgi:hypothetical protein